MGNIKLISFGIINASYNEVKQNPTIHINNMYKYLLIIGLKSILSFLTIVEMSLIDIFIEYTVNIVYATIYII